MEMITPPKQIKQNMLNDGWIRSKHIHLNMVSLELVLMYQHGVLPVNEPNINIARELFLRITIDGQINERKKLLKECIKARDNNYFDYYEEAMQKVHQQQIDILENLKISMIIQYN